MTRAALGEYAAALRERYVAAGKKEKGRILDELCRTDWSPPQGGDQAAERQSAAWRALETKEGAPYPLRPGSAGASAAGVGSVRPSVWEASGGSDETACRQS